MDSHAVKTNNLDVGQTVRLQSPVDRSAFRNPAQHSETPRGSRMTDDEHPMFQQGLVLNVLPVFLICDRIIHIITFYRNDVVFASQHTQIKKTRRLKLAD